VLNKNKNMDIKDNWNKLTPQMWVNTPITSAGRRRILVKITQGINYTNPDLHCPKSPQFSHQLTLIDGWGYGVFAASSALVPHEVPIKLGTGESDLWKLTYLQA
jgi:hypothetical protein